MFNSSININQTSPNRQPSQHILKPNQKVYLYGDTNFTGTLIRSLEGKLNLEVCIVLQNNLKNQLF